MQNFSSSSSKSWWCRNDSVSLQFHILRDQMEQWRVRSWEKVAPGRAYIASPSQPSFVNLSAYKTAGEDHWGIQHSFVFLSFSTGPIPLTTSCSILMALHEFSETRKTIKQKDSWGHYANLLISAAAGYVCDCPLCNHLYIVYAQRIFKMSRRATESHFKVGRASSWPIHPLPGPRLRFNLM